MPRFLAQLFCLVFIIWLWCRDSRSRPNLSPALWIPTLWLLLLGSRPLSFWLGFSGSGSDLEGNSFDRTIYLLGIVCSAAILARRGVVWSAVIRKNWPIFLFYAYLGLSILWAEYQFVTFKRWFKEIGGIAVILLILTDKNPRIALEAVFLRCAYVLFSLSVLFIKYIPELGRSNSESGENSYGGVTQQKNSLGEIVLVFGLFIIFRLLRLSEVNSGRWFSKESRVDWLLLGIGSWLLWISDSKTATLCLAAGAGILFSYRLPVLRSNPKYVTIGLLFLVASFFLLEKGFHVSEEFFRLIGRNPTLTNRTEIWAGVKEHPVNPLIGCGYLMFWDINPKVQVGEYEAELKTAHNGYLEIYLDGGWIGIGVLGIMLFGLGIWTARALHAGLPYGRLQFAFFVVMVIYNVSESMFARRSPLWFAFLLFCWHAPQMSKCFPKRLPATQEKKKELCPNPA